MQTETAIRFRVTPKMRSLLDRLRDEEDINVSVVDQAAAPQPDVPHHDLDDEAEIRHLDIDYRLTATAVHCAPVAARTSTPPPGEPRQPAPGVPPRHQDRRFRRRLTDA